MRSSVNRRRKADERREDMGRTLTPHEGMLSRIEELVDMQVDGLATSDAIGVLVHSLSWVIAHARREEGEDADELVAKTKRQLSKEVKRTVEIWDEVDRGRRGASAGATERAARRAQFRCHFDQKLNAITTASR